MRESARITLTVAWLATAGFARAQAPANPYAALSGVVLNDATGTPIRRAIVTLSTPPLEAVTLTESNGAFAFTAIPPGKYQLQAEMDGFQKAWFGAATPARPAITLNLAAGDSRYGITFRLRPLGAISGVVFDPDGDPVANVGIRLLRAGFEHRKPTYWNSGVATTDLHGRYRVGDVLPGQYVIMAVPEHEAAGAIQPEIVKNPSRLEKMYAVDFYPDSNKVSAAAPLSMVSGKEFDDIDFHLSTRAVATLAGKIAMPDDARGVSMAHIFASPQDTVGDRSTGAGTTVFAPDFIFQIPYLVPGPYMIVAMLSAPGREYRAAEQVDLPPSGQEITLHPDRGIDLSGRVDLEGGGSRSGKPMHVTLTSDDSPPALAQPFAEVKPDGTFTIPNVFPGTWDIDVKPVSEGSYLKAMLLGDQDVLTEDMVIMPNAREQLHIVLSTRAGEVSGTVTIPPGAAKSARAKVLLAPLGRYENVLSFYKVTTADDAGHFEFTSVTPGRYKLYAFEELEPDAYDDPGFLKAFERLSEAFDVTEGGHVSREALLIEAGRAPATEN